MRKRRMMMLVIVAVVGLALYSTFVGFSTPVKDFNQPKDTTPTGTYGFTWNSTSPEGSHPSTPTSLLVFKSINFDFKITNLGIANGPSGSDFMPSLKIDSFTDHQAFYTGMAEGRIYTNQPLSFSWGTPAPSLPATRSWVVHVDVTGYCGNYDFHAYWNDTTVHKASFSTFDITGSTGRMFTSASGTYNAKITCVDSVNGLTYAGMNLIFVVQAYQGTVGT